MHVKLKKFLERSLLIDLIPLQGVVRIDAGFWRTYRPTSMFRDKTKQSLKLRFYNYQIDDISLQSILVRKSLFGLPNGLQQT